MSAIRINKSFDIEGAFSFRLSYDETTNLVEIRGELLTDKGYLPQITSLENERYLLDGIKVYAEDYNSESDEMVYNFVAKQYAISDSLQEVKTIG